MLIVSTGIWDLKTNGFAAKLFHVHLSEDAQYVWAVGVEYKPLKTLNLGVKFMPDNKIMCKCILMKDGSVNVPLANASMSNHDGRVIVKSPRLSRPPCTRCTQCTVKQLMNRTVVIEK